LLVEVNRCALAAHPKGDKTQSVAQVLFGLEIGSQFVLLGRIETIRPIVSELFWLANKLVIARGSDFNYFSVSDIDAQKRRQDGRQIRQLVSGVLFARRDPFVGPDAVFALVSSNPSPRGTANRICCACGDGEMGNFFTETGERVCRQVHRQPPLGPEIQRDAVRFGARCAIPFTSVSKKFSVAVYD
jgi:hypothetical protein